MINFGTKPIGKRWITLLSIILLVSLSVRSQETHLQVQASELSKWSHYLASDEMKGRANGSPEMEEAANFIEEKFKEFGLKPLPGLDGIIQNYSFTNRQGKEIDERNIIGYLEGSDPELKNEFLIFSSHFDHIGIRKAIDGDSIYNGANDNVAGTITIMGLAKTWNELGIRPARSVIFAAYSAEEVGMKGSGYFSRNLPFDASSIFLNLNMEMTGHCTELGPKTYYITGPGYTNLDELFAEFNQQSEWKQADEPNADRLFFVSDNVVFAVDRSGDQMKLNIPAHTLCTHGGEDHIHKPHDEPQFMDYNNIAELVKYLSGLGIHLGSMKKGSIQWDHEAFAKDMSSRSKRRR